MLNHIKKIVDDENVRLIGRLAIDHDAAAYLVGGALRNLFLGRKLKDLDFVLSGACEELPRRFASCIGGSFFWLDKERLQSRVVKKTGADNLTYDFAPQAGGTIEADLCRRDFTINAMALTISGKGGTLLDPTGGRTDLEKGIVRACSPLVFSDDPLRLLRAIRFAATLGFTIERDTWQALVQEAPLLVRVAGERVRDELFQVLAASGVERSLTMLGDSGLLAQICPPPSVAAGRTSLAQGIRTAGRLEAIAAASGEYFPAEADFLNRQLNLEVQAGVTVLSLLKLAAFGEVAFISGGIKPLADRLRLGKRAGRMLEIFAGKGPALASLAGEELSKQAMYRVFRDAEPVGPELVIYAMAAGKVGPDLCTRLIDYYCHTYVASGADLLLSGADVMRLLGIRPGRVVGEALEQLREAESTGMVNSKAAAEAFIKRNLLTNDEPIG